jgi:hypothetical protein
MEKKEKIKLKLFLKAASNFFLTFFIVLLLTLLSNIRLG